MPEQHEPTSITTRERILEHIRSNPGAYLRGIVRALGLSVGVVEYHLHVLERSGAIASMPLDGKKRYHLREGVDERDVRFLVRLREALPRKIVLHLLLHPGSRFTDILRHLGISKSTLSFHMGRLVASGMVMEQPLGREKMFWVEDPVRVVEMLLSHRGSLVDDAVDRFIEAWMGL